MISRNRSGGMYRVFIVLVLAFFSRTVFAWTDDIDSLPDINTLCKPEPKAQCTQAVRIGLEAPGVNWSDSSMVQMRLDGANLQGANLSGSILQLANLNGANGA